MVRDRLEESQHKEINRQEVNLNGKCPFSGPDWVVNDADDVVVQVLLVRVQALHQICTIAMQAQSKKQEESQLYSKTEFLRNQQKRASE